MMWFELKISCVQNWSISTIDRHRLVHSSHGNVPPCENQKKRRRPVAPKERSSHAKRLRVSASSSSSSCCSSSSTSSSSSSSRPSACSASSSSIDRVVTPLEEQQRALQRELDSLLPFRPPTPASESSENTLVPPGVPLPSASHKTPEFARKHKPISSSLLQVTKKRLQSMKPKSAFVFSDGCGGERCDCFQYFRESI